MAAKIEELMQLRQSIIEGIIPLLDNESLEPLERFALLSRLAQSQGSLEYYQKAFDAARALEREEQLRSFMTLLDEVEYEIDVNNSEGSDVEIQKEPAAVADTEETVRSQF